MRFAAVLLLFVAACAKSSATAADGPATESPCTPAKVGRPNAKPVALSASTCTPRGTLGPNAKPCVLGIGSTTTITSEKDLADVYDCRGAPSGLDFTNEVLVVMIHLDSPGSMGFDTLERWSLRAEGDQRSLPQHVPAGPRPPADPRVPPVDRPTLVRPRLVPRQTKLPLSVA